jgi:hypothetical protein
LGTDITLCLLAGLLSIAWFGAVKVVNNAKAD